MPHRQISFFFGAGTNNGKTYASAFWPWRKESPADVIYYKPIETYDEDGDGDSDAVRRIWQDLKTGGTVLPAEIRIAIPRSPHTALQKVLATDAFMDRKDWQESPYLMRQHALGFDYGDPDWPIFAERFLGELLHKITDAVDGRDEFHIVVESAGGIMVELLPGLTNTDAALFLKRELAKKIDGLDWQTVVTSHGRLGAINASLLTLHTLAGLGLSADCFIVNRTKEDSDSALLIENLAEIKRRSHFEESYYLDYWQGGEPVWSSL